MFDTSVNELQLFVACIIDKVIIRFRSSAQSHRRIAANDLLCSLEM